MTTFTQAQHRRLIEENFKLQEQVNRGQDYLATNENIDESVRYVIKKIIVDNNHKLNSNRSILADYTVIIKK